MKLHPFPLKYILSPQVLLKSIRYVSSKPQWNSNPNPNLIISHPTLVLIESCNSMPELKQLQAHMTRTGLIFHLFPISRLLSFCALDPNGNIHYAYLLFSQILHPNTYIWNTMIRGYANSPFPEMALFFFNRMISEDVEMDNKSYVFSLKGCGFLSGIERGLLVHCRIWKVGFVDDLIVRNALVHFYSEKRQLCNAKTVFLESTVRDVVSWTSMIDGFVRKSMADEALNFFQKMCSSGFEPNEVTMIAVCSACSLKGDLTLARSVHELVARKGVKCSLNLMNSILDMHVKCGDLDKAEKIFQEMEVKDVFSWTSMINGYAKNGDIELARKCFNEMPQRNAVSWTAMVSCYSQNNRPREALEIFSKMEMEGFIATESSLVCVLSACSQLSCLHTGKRIHDYVKQERVTLSLILANALIDMYAKCGCIDAAADIFNKMPEKDLVSWNSLIAGNASHGHAEEALVLFEQMISIGFKPDSITFVGILSACAHGGLVNQGWNYFRNMKVHGLIPTVEHYACLVDLLSRVGHLEEAHGLIKQMPMQPDAAVWGALLNGCKMHGNLKLGNLAADKLIFLDPKDSGIYTLLASLCAKERKWSDVKMVRSMMKAKGTKKNPGCSFIEVDGKFHEFLVADETHPESKAIYLLLDEIFLLSELELYSSGHEYTCDFSPM
ncbi:unnamed protein product [Coffea canephora]|uniref:Uncharacterized protein n=1 Tax=Coffea canephora TaxID=49390 RepID=A0A068UU48_COFCA|nr:unnamed protein product [Coffea canephora]